MKPSNVELLSHLAYVRKFQEPQENFPLNQKQGIEFPSRLGGLSLRSPRKNHPTGRPTGKGIQLSPGDVVVVVVISGFVALVDR